VLEMVASASPAEEIVVLGFSLDRDDLVQTLIGARRRGCYVRVALDRAMTLQGRTRDQLSAAKSLVSAGISVRVVAGVPLADEYAAVGRRVGGHLRGIQHSKAVLVGRKLIAGSCNFTTSSRSNWEVGLQVTVKHPAIVQEFMLAAWNAGTELSEAQISDAQRARSSSPSGRGKR
jgi:phosphatidylserine/phosphatidylglycerophosphate/cardiolipin synthase-like enzyme